MKKETKKKDRFPRRRTRITPYKESPSEFIKEWKDNWGKEKFNSRHKID